MEYLHHPLAIPLLSLVAGVIILIFPTILNYIVGIYLVLIGVIGLISFLR